MLEKFLKKRHSLRSISDEEFERILPTLAKELEGVDYLPTHSPSSLLNDWNALCEWTTDEPNISSRMNVGMKLCEHFFPNFYKIKNKRGVSFESLWNETTLKKVLRWNRGVHSTPYLSEIKRGIYFCGGLSKNTMYRPQMAKMICDQYKSKIVFDPCCGWGGRMLGAVASGAVYVGFEPNTETYHGLIKLAEFLNITDKVNIINDDALQMESYDIPKCDLVLTSPPYFNVEIYTEEDTQSINGKHTYDAWEEQFLQPLIRLSLKHLRPSGVSAWNVSNTKVEGKDMWNGVISAHRSAGYHPINEFNVVSSKRATRIKNTSEKSMDTTRVFGTIHKSKVTKKEAHKHWYPSRNDKRYDFKEE